MQRKEFLTLLAGLPLLNKMHSLENITKNLSSTSLMPVLFLGHGSPMNAIEDNEFVKGFKAISSSITKPNAILCISAHWETKGTQVTAMEHPKTIHDFGGFPKELFEVQYPAPGNPQLAVETKQLLTKTEVQLDDKWGLDHGAWSVIKHLYPKADVPVIQLSLDYYKTPQQHYEIAKELSSLRKKGVLIVGSGNIVHNLGMVAWDKFNANNYAYDWAIEASTKIKKYILDGNHKALIEFDKQGKEFKNAIPTPEHFLPLLYTLALQEKNESINIFNDKAVAGSLTMTSLKIG
ncbi:MAG: 4,5-DOPA dioxygenase extradiol [Ferruginibacter sp.]|nr:4,5-DOPA dioxygenase extradiol [Ferruginibacter sp.]